MKKIKSVKLKNDYRTGYSYMEAGAPLVWETDDNKWLLKGICRWNEQEIINNKTGLFKIEYEEERKYIDVRIGYFDDEIIFPFNTKLIEEVLKKEFFESRKIEVLELGRGEL